MLRFQIIKRMYCTPIGNYSFARNTTPRNTTPRNTTPRNTTPRNTTPKKTIKTVKQLNIKIVKKNNKETREYQWRPHD